MYLRGRQCRICFFQRGIVSISLRSSNSARFSTTLYRLAKVPPQTFQSNQQGGDGAFKRTSIRPITLFAICIPLGYALSWALRVHEDATDPDGFVKYILADRQEVSSTCSIFTLRPSTTSTVRTDDPILNRVITSVQFKQPQLQIARSYTLLPPTKSQDPHLLRFLIRKERNGEVSGYLHRLPIGSELELRGLSAEYVLPGKVKTVLFLAGGTGIAPAMQVADALAGEANVHIMWASRKREDCAGGLSDRHDSSHRRAGLWNWRSIFGISRVNADQQIGAVEQEKSIVVAQLETLKQQTLATPSSTHSTRLLVDYFVDEEGTFIQSKDVSQLLQRAALESKGTKLLFVAGPDGFVNHWASSKVWMNGQEVQGPLGGVLETMDLRGWEVVKL